VTEAAYAATTRMARKSAGNSAEFAKAVGPPWRLQSRPLPAHTGRMRTEQAGQNLGCRPKLCQPPSGRAGAVQQKNCLILGIISSAGLAIDRSSDPSLETLVT